MAVDEVRPCRRPFRSARHCTMFVSGGRFERPSCRLACMAAPLPAHCWCLISSTSRTAFPAPTALCAGAYRLSLRLLRLCSSRPCSTDHRVLLSVVPSRMTARDRQGHSAVRLRQTPHFSLLTPNCLSPSPFVPCLAGRNPRHGGELGLVLKKHIFYLADSICKGGRCTLSFLVSTCKTRTTCPRRSQFNRRAAISISACRRTPATEPCILIVSAVSTCN